MGSVRLPAWYYRQFDADFTLDIPAEGYDGWRREEIEISLEHTAVVVMHAWDAGTREHYPGWHRAVEYIPRSYDISLKVLPGLLSAVRSSGFALFHVAGGGDYFRSCPGYLRAVQLAGPPPDSPRQIESDPILDRLRTFRSENVFPGSHNLADVGRGFKEQLDFREEARPLGDEGVAETGHQLFALCEERGINHLIYSGFAINWCLLLSPGGMADMQARGFMCSAIRQAVTAVENRETARRELCKELALWRVAIGFGFVFDVDDLVGVLEHEAPPVPARSG